MNAMALNMLAPVKRAIAAKLLHREAELSLSPKPGNVNSIGRPVGFAAGDLVDGAAVAFTPPTFVGGGVNVGAEVGGMEHFSSN